MTPLMRTPTEHGGTFLARAYQFERNRTASFISGTADWYALPGCWGERQPVWRKLASITRTRKIDPVRYVRWSLGIPQLGYPMVIPEPNRLLMSRSMDRYQAGLDGVRRAIEIRLGIEKATARRHLIVRQSAHGLTPEIAQIDVLSDYVHFGLSPLFCHVLARFFGTKKLMKLAGRFEEDALFQFSRDPEENEAVYGASGYLAADFAARAAELYERTVERHAASIAGGVKK